MVWVRLTTVWLTNGMGKVDNWYRRQMVRLKNGMVDKWYGRQTVFE